MSAPPSKPRLPLRKKLLFSLVPLLAILLLAEVVCRVQRGVLFANYRLLRIDYMQRGYPAEPDATLGYVPRPNYASSDNYWETAVTIDADGVRSNGATDASEGEPIVAVGDSFTFGDQVGDAETWPAYLEEELGCPVKNGGVFGYSLGQSVLRAEALVERYNAELLVFSMISDDVRRCEFSRRYAEKPWFSIEGGALVQHGAAVADGGPSNASSDENWFKNALGYSALLDAVFSHLGDEWKTWWFIRDKLARVHDIDGAVAVSKLLIERIDDFCEARGCAWLLVVQGDELQDFAIPVIDHARARGVRVLDLVAAFDAAKAADPDVDRRYFDGHMTAAGNAWVAGEIATAVRSMPVADRTEQPVRTLVEREERVLPPIVGGDRLGDGSGVLSVLLRGRDGKLLFDSVERGRVPPADEVVGDARPKSASPVSFSLRRPEGDRDGVEVFVGNRSIGKGPAVGLAAVRAALETNPSQVFVIPKPGIEYGHVLAVAAEAHAIGARVSFGGGFSRRPEPTDKPRVLSMPKKLVWQNEGDFYRVEVLFCFDHDEAWGNLAVLMQELAFKKVWRIGLIGRDARGRFAKVPVRLTRPPE